MPRPTVSRSNPEWRQEFEEALPDLAEEDIAGSGFAITGYKVHRLGGDTALARLRERMRQRGLQADARFRAQPQGLDHPWVESHPEYSSTAPRRTWSTLRRITSG